jgi:hypothetical protein
VHGICYDARPSEYLGEIRAGRKLTDARAPEEQERVLPSERRELLPSGV